MNIYISSSWKNREKVREMAIKLRELGHEVFDFTDPTYREIPQIAPETIPQYNPVIHDYKGYISQWKTALEENKKAILWADLIVLLLPCGIDAHVDWALGVGAGKQSVIVGYPNPGERMPTHNWADDILENEDEFYLYLKLKAKVYSQMGLDKSHIQCYEYAKNCSKNIEVCENKPFKDPMCRACPMNK